MKHTLQTSCKAGYELRGFKTKYAIITAAIVVGTLAVALPLLGWMSHQILHERVAYRSQSMVNTNINSLFPAPRLQSNPNATLKDYMTAGEKTLNSYGWVNKPLGIVRIPISRAMDLLAAGQK